MKEQRRSLSNEGRRDLKDKTETIAVTHVNADLDGRIAKEILDVSNFSKIDEMIFWGGGYLKLPAGTHQVIFLDCSPDHNLRKYLQKEGIKLMIIDHHPHLKYPDPTDKKYPYQTTVSLILEKSKDQLNLTEEKIRKFVEWSKKADFGTGGDYMNIANLIRTMNLFYSDPAVQKWTQVIIKSELVTRKVDFDQGRKFFIGSLEIFLRKHQKLVSRGIIRRFIREAKKPDILKDSMNIALITAKVLARLGEEKTREWLFMAIQSIEEKQREFWAAYNEIEKATIATTGNSVVIMGVSDSPEFSQAARRYGKRNHGKVPIVAKVLPCNKGFQIFGDGKNDLGEIIKALRVEILEKREKEIPTDRRLLQQEGTISGTNPLYYHKAEYSIIMWGSFTRPNVRKVDIWEETLKEVIMKVLDPEFFPNECKKSRKCLENKCSLRKYRLQRCYQRRTKNTEIRRRSSNTREEILANDLQRELGPRVTVKIEK